MFKGVESQDSNNTVIGSDVMLTGNLKSSGNVQINGKVKGKIQTKSDILVGESAVIEGGVKANNVRILGRLHGNIETKEDLEISPTGRVFGDIVSKNLIMQKGGTITGKIIMDKVPDISSEPGESQDIEAEEAVVEKK
jgi:cytoskeletal protein CcmA (bactofilin family)